MVRRVMTMAVFASALTIAGCGGGGSNPDVGLDADNPGLNNQNLNNGTAQVFQPGTGYALVQGTVDLGAAQVTGRAASATSLRATITATQIDVSPLTGVATSTAVGSVTTDSVGRYKLSLAKNKLYKLSATFTLSGSKTLWTYLLPGDSHDRVAMEDVDITPEKTGLAMVLDYLVNLSATDSFTYSAINSTVRGYATVAATGAQLTAAVNSYLTGQAGAFPMAVADLAATNPIVADRLANPATGAGTIFTLALNNPAVLAAALPAGTTLPPADTQLSTQLNQALTTSLTQAQQSAAGLDAGMAQLGATPVALANWPAAVAAPTNWKTKAITLDNYKGFGIEVKPNFDIYEASAFAYDSQNNTFVYGRDIGSATLGRAWTYTTVRGFLLTPVGQPPSGGWPVIVYQHGVTRQAADMFMIADDFVRAGYAVMGIDAVMHGRRLPGGKTTTGAALALDEFTAAAGATADTNGNLCQVTGAILAALGSSVPNGAGYLFNYFGCGVPAAVSAQLNALVPQPTLVNGTPIQPSSKSYLAALYLRDNQIQTVEDQRALFNWLGTNGEGLNLNPRRLHYVGMSLGVMIGAISVAVNTNTDTTTAAPAGRVRSAVFNVGGANWGTLLNTTDDVSFGAIAQALVGASCPNPLLQVYGTCQTATTSGLEAFVSGLNSTGQKAFTGGDPLNWAGNIKVPVHLQNASDDKVFKPATADALYSVLTRGNVSTTRSYFSANHGFFLDIVSPNSGQARREIITFFNSNT